MLILLIRIIITIKFLFITEISSQTNCKLNSNLIREKAENILFKKRLLIYEKIMDRKMKNHRDDYSVNPIFQEYKENVIGEIIKRSFPNSSDVNSLDTISFLQLKRKVPDPDSPHKFFTNGKFERNIEKIPLRGSVVRKPWSGSYWPMRSGLIAVRYGRNEKNTIGQIDKQTGVLLREYNWTESVNIYKQPQEHNNQIRFNNINYQRYVNSYYSPSEKYDLLVGDYDFSLTNWNKEQGKKWSGQYKGDLPKWFGICHGWAPATYEHKKPVKTINVTAADGRTKLTFFPDDIKALSSLYWANVYYTTNFVGGICRVQPPKKPVSDNATGLYLETPCHSINPASMVLIIANHVGIKRKNLVLDPLSDPEVWNQPIVSYLFKYYNLITKDFSSSPNRVRIPIDNIRNSKDPFLNFISKQADKRTRFVVGVYMNITYTYETSPVHSSRPLDDFNKTDEFIAALELDSNNSIIGGEWKYNAHPNFIWKADDEKSVQGCCDHFVKNFTGKVNPTTTRWAKEASKKGQVIKSILEYLLELSANPKQDEEDRELDYSNYLPTESGNGRYSSRGSNISGSPQNTRNRVERMESDEHRRHSDLFHWVVE